MSPSPTHPYAALVIAVSLLGGACASGAVTPSVRRVQATSGAVEIAAASADQQRQDWLNMFARGYFPGRSGQVFVVPREGDIITERDPLYQFMHGSPWDYDTRIPLLFYGGPAVRPGRWPGPASQQDIAPTLGAMIGAPAVPTYTGHPLARAIGAGAPKPRIAAVVVLDAMRADYFDTYAGVMPTMTRLRREGAWFPDARANVLPTVTGVGHATIGTGADPRIHGITVNTLFNRATGKPQPAYDALDPRELMALTLADTWNLATDGRAVIIGQGGAIRATAGLVGRGSCLVGARKVVAASYNAGNGEWETNPECYTMPRALGAFKAREVWEAAGGRWLGHDIASGSKFRASSLFQKFEAEALLAVMDDSAIGEDEVTDLVMVNMKGPDYAAHAYGPDSPELEATLAELDRQMAAFLALLDRKAGIGQSVVAITADHGTPGEGGPGRRHHTDQIIPLINARFDPEGKIVQYYGDAANSQLYLDTARLRSLGHSLADVAAMLEGLDFFVAAFTEDEVREAQARLPAPGATATATRALAALANDCQAAIDRQVADWRGGARRVAPAAVGDGPHLIHPTDRLGVWLDLRRAAGGGLALTRLSPEGATTVTWTADCRPRFEERRAAAAARADEFSDADLASLVAGGARAAVYVWSPHMPLSVDGLAAFTAAAAPLGITTVAVLDPQSDRDYAASVARSAGLPADVTRVARSIELAFQGAFVHAPAVMVFDDGRAIGPPVPGYRDPAGYDALLRALVGAPSR